MLLETGELIVNDSLQWGHRACDVWAQARGRGTDTPAGVRG